MIEMLCTVPVLAGFLAACAPPPPLATGYVEGEFRLIAPVSTARIDGLAVRRGDRVAEGAVIARMETRDAEIEVARAAAALEHAESVLANLEVGLRPEEVQVIEASLASARAEAAESAREAERLERLRAGGIVPQAQLDDAELRREIALARVAEVEANLAVARLPAREHEIEAAQAGVAQAQAQLDAARWALGQREIAAPSGGVVTEILRTEGEVAGPQAPILSFLPDAAVLLRLYVPQAAVAGLAPGGTLAVNCDGCPPGLTATVVYVADTPEFTPPVIYSIENRQRLVYLVEARPDDGAGMLKPGQIVDVRLDDAE